MMELTTVELICVSGGLDTMEKQLVKPTEVQKLPTVFLEGFRNLCPPGFEYGTGSDYNLIVKNIPREWGFNITTEISGRSLVVNGSVKGTFVYNAERQELNVYCRTARNRPPGGNPLP